jgi:HEAT repeat protein
MDKILAALNSEKAGEREKALEGMQAGEITEAVIQKVLTILEQDNNENVCIAACKLVGKNLYPEAIPILMNLILNTQGNNAVRFEAILSLGKYGENLEILQFFDKILTENQDKELNHKVISALIGIKCKHSAKILAKQLGIKDKNLKARIAWELGSSSIHFSEEEATAVLVQLREYASRDSDPSVRRASISSSTK